MSVLPPDPVFVLRHSDMDSINSLAFYKDEKLFAGTLKGTVQLWDLQVNNSYSHQPLNHSLFSLDLRPIVVAPVLKWEVIPLLLCITPIRI